MRFMSSEAAATPIPRRGRLLVIGALTLAILALGYGLVEMSTREAGRESIRIDGIEAAQATFGGVPQAGDRLGSANAPVSVQVFADLQCGTCRASFLGAIPGLVERYVRPGEAKLLLRHYSVARNNLELGFFGAEAAAEKGYGWQYTYLFFRNQAEAERFGVTDRFLESVAGAIGELDVGEWRDYLDREGGTDGEIARRLEAQEQLGTDLGIRLDVAALVSGPEGTRTLQDGPSRAEIERAISEVGGSS
jgi:protein-disulfide isomerase